MHFFFFAFNLIIHIQVKDMTKNATFQQPTEINGIWNYVSFTQYTNYWYSNCLKLDINKERRQNKTSQTLVGRRMTVIIDSTKIEKGITLTNKKKKKKISHWGERKWKQKRASVFCFCKEKGSMCCAAC